MLSSQCKAKLYLNSPAFDVSVFLQDDFGTIVKGEIITSYPQIIQLSQSPSDVSYTTKNNTVLVNSTSGSATFKDIKLCGPNNETITLHFNDIPNRFTISNFSCTILLVGCINENEIPVDPLSKYYDNNYYISYDNIDCWYCESVVTPNPDSPLPAFYIVLICVIITNFILCFIFAAFCIYRLHKKRKLKLIEAIEIPDFSVVDISLDDILNDSSIKKIPRDHITIGEAIGRGACGVVSSGIWNQT